MIKSNMDEVYRNTYISYISSRYGRVWQLCTRGNEVFPLIGVSSVERIFGITVDQTKVPPRRMRTSGYDEHCDIQEMYYNQEQFDVIAFTYNLRERKAYRDLLVAHELVLYDSYRTDVLGLWADDMYNAVQLHKEFCDALQTYLSNILDEHVSVNESDFSLDVNPQHGVCYKELMDYAHYEGLKPEIKFRITVGGRRMRGVIQPNDYVMQFEETSYNIRIDNIQFF